MVFEVIATHGDSLIGGEYFNNRVIKHFKREWKKQTGLDVTSDKSALQKLRQEVETAKKVLSKSDTVELKIYDFMDGRDFRESLTRKQFEELNDDLFQKTISSIDIVLKDAKLQKSQIDEIILVGGSSRIPKIRELVQNYFNGKAINTKLNPEEAAVSGAAILGTIVDFLIDDRN